MDMHSTVAIIGAGPYGLSLAARLKQQGIHPLLFGVPMKTWVDMPEDLYLRSKITSAFNPFGDYSFGEFISEQGVIIAENPPPIPRTLFLEYARWFLRRHKLHPIEESVNLLDRKEGGVFSVVTHVGNVYEADRVVVANGINDYVNVPHDLLQNVPEALWVHTADCADVERFHGEHVLIIGGRQAGLEWSALLAEHGATVTAVYRHDTPDFKTPNWEILKEIIAGTLSDPAWFKHLSESEREHIVNYVRPAAKRQVEPWLKERVMRPEIALRPKTDITRLYAEGNHVYAEVTDQRMHQTSLLGPFAKVICATGYQPALSRVPFLSDGLRAAITMADEYPDLSEYFESSVPRLHFTGLIAERSFGPLMGFMNMCDASATILCKRLCGS